MKRIKYLAVVLGLLGIGAFAEERAKSFYKIAHLSQSVVGVSCPGNFGTPTVVGNYSGILVISCGTKSGN